MEYTENKLILSTAGKKKYLDKLKGRVIKILYLIEEEAQTGFSPSDYIYGLLIEVNSANQLFDNELVEIVVKLNIVYKEYRTAPFTAIRKQIFEVKNKIGYLKKNVK